VLVAKVVRTGRGKRAGRRPGWVVMVDMCTGAEVPGRGVGPGVSIRLAGRTDGPGGRADFAVGFLDAPALREKSPESKLVEPKAAVLPAFRETQVIDLGTGRTSRGLNRVGLPWPRGYRAPGTPRQPGGPRRRTGWARRMAHETRGDVTLSPKTVCCVPVHQSMNVSLLGFSWRGAGR